MVAVQTHSRGDDLAELLPYVLERCDHEPPADQDGPAVCHTCENVLAVLVDRMDDPGEPLH